MDLLTRVDRLGGVASWALLTHWHEPGEVLAAVEVGTLHRTRRGRYALPTADVARRAAHQLSAVVGLRSAAATWGWPLKTQPERPEIIVPRGRKVPPELQRAYAVRWRRLSDRDVASWRTTPLRTVIDCAREFPLDEALAVADSALRCGMVDHQELLLAAGRSPVRGRGRAEHVAWHASPKPAGPFESVIRGLSLDIAGLRLRPQVLLKVAGRHVRPDLVDEHLRLIVEGDSHEFHTSRHLLPTTVARVRGLSAPGPSVDLGPPASNGRR